jgi:hypothetical protein
MSGIVQEKLFTATKTKKIEKFTSSETIFTQRPRHAAQRSCLPPIPSLKRATGDSADQKRLITVTDLYVWAFHRTSNKHMNL